MSNKKRSGKLILEDGSVLTGLSFGSDKAVNGEVVFNTGMVGYPETLTDPSYKGQILVLTYPLIGNYGVPGRERENELLKNFESEKIQIQGLIITNLSEDYSHWSAKESLADWLKENDIPYKRLAPEDVAKTAAQIIADEKWSAGSREGWNSGRARWARGRSSVTPEARRCRGS